MRRTIRTLPIAIVVLLAALTRAEATFHFMVIEEVYPGSFAHPDAQYVVLRSTFSLQNLLTGHEIATFDPAGNPLADFGVFDHNSPNNANLAHYIMATQAAVDLFKFTATQIVDGSLPFPDGRLCWAFQFTDYVDCVAYGNFTGSNSTWGTPATALVRQKALKRIRTLTPHNNSIDYTLGAPNPTDELNLNRPDGDGDGIPNISDCAPTNAAVWDLPLEISNLSVDRTPDGLGGFTTSLSWVDQEQLAGPGTVYDLIVQELAGSASPPPWTTATCLAPNLPLGPFSEPAPDPPIGMARLYLARAENVCAAGTYGNYNPGLVPSPPPDPRDPLDLPASTPCP